MSLSNDHFASLRQHAISSALAIAQANLAAIEQFASLNIDAARTLVRDSLSGALSLAQAQGPDEIFSVGQSFVIPRLEHAIDWSHSLHEISSRTRNELSRHGETYVRELAQSVIGLFDPERRYQSVAKLAETGASAESDHESDTSSLTSRSRRKAA
ncbi:MAG: phasin family protein [Azoarcus sp.]|nr:phasin family protein [Azoarcus sp.]